MSKILITGGAGFLGTAIIGTLGTTHDYIVYSRDEAKHLILKEKFKNTKIKLKTIIGDVRDNTRLCKVISEEKPSNVVIAHALKQIKACEDNYSECLKTNVDGTLNVIETCNKVAPFVRKVCFISTDKAVNPCSIYGSSKKICEQIITQESNRKGANIKFCSVRYGNVINSTGSVIPLFKKQCQDKKEITVNSIAMTRFLLDVNQAVYLIANALFEDVNGIVVPIAVKSAKIIDIARYFVKKYGLPEKAIKIGIPNHFEKIHETLVSTEEKFDLTTLKNVGMCVVVNNKHGKEVAKNNRQSNDNDCLMSQEETFAFLAERGI